MASPRGRSFQNQLLLAVMAIAVPLTVLLVASSFYSIRVTNEKIAESHQRSLEFCVRQVERELSGVDQTLVSLMAGSGDFLTLSGGGGTRLQAYLSALSLYNQLKTILPSYPSVGAFFLYSVPSQVERDAFTGEFSYEEKEAVRRRVRQMVEEDAQSYGMGWRWASIGEKTYLLRFFGGRGTYLAAMVPLELLQEDPGWQAGQETAAVAALDGQALTGREFVEEQQIDLAGDYSGYFFTGSPHRYMVLGEEIGGTNCRLVFLISGGGYLDSLTPVQTALLVLSLLAVTAIPLLLAWVRRSLVAPVEDMTATIRRIQQGELEAQVATQGRVLEFQQMGETFNNLMGQIRDLKIAAYEKEIESQKAQLRYLQLQIRPHFFLNCLKSLYALAQQQEYGKIQRMILAFSRHIRYIFGDSMELVPLRRELEHVRNYMEIQSISGVRPPRCTVEADPRLLELPIPPLSLQTFVENSVKHGTDPDHPLEMEVRASVLASGEELYADLTVSDNGGGFPEQALQELNDPDGGSVYAQRHVGIHNVKKRMSLMYGDQVLFAFFNTGRGSVSEILIPIGRDRLEPPADRGKEETV